MANSAIHDTKSLDNSKDIVLTLDGTLRNAYLIQSAAAKAPAAAPGGGGSIPNGWYLCSEPQPDAAMQLASKASLSAKGGKLGADASADAVLEYNTAIVQLAGRSSSVLIARDFMFNICVLRANGFIDNEEAYQLANQTIGMIRDITRTDKIQAAAQAAKQGVPVEPLTSTLSYTNEREIALTQMAVDLLKISDRDKRKKVITDAFACANDQKTCQVQRDGLIAAEDLETVISMIARQPSGRITGLQTELNR